MVVYLRKSIRSLLSLFKKKAGPRDQDEQKRLTVHYTTSQHYQENVFIEGSRPQYLEDLHTEALEGLRNLQQEEKNGADVQDGVSPAATATPQTGEEDPSPKDREGSLGPGSAAGQSGTTATSAVSTRPVLTRQGSTFKPLNPVKRLDKNRKRTRRTTIMGIPQQVQRELALHRGSMYQQGASSQLHGNGHASDRAVVIPTIDGDSSVARPEGARVHLQDLEASREEQLLHHHLHVVYKGDQAFGNHHPGTRLSPASSRRPKSLAVPGMTTPSSSTAFHFLQEPLGPVMSISPQATYLSKIIPNAILPASVDVIQIDRGNSRNRGSSMNHGGNGRTASRTSLGSGKSSASPASSRRSGGDGSHADGFHSNPTATHPTASNCSQSQSSETIISNSSTFSSKEGSHKGMPQTMNRVRQGEQPKRTAGDQDLVSLNSSASWVSGTSSMSGGPSTGQGSESGMSGTVTAGESTRSFSRSLSILKTKLPPAPPQRTNSLHHDKVIRPRELLGVKDLSDSAFTEEEIPEANSPARDENMVASLNSTFKCPVQVSDSPESRSLEDSRSLASPCSLSPSQCPPRAEGAPEPQAVSSNSSPQKVLSEGGKFERTMSPSSGYSSQSGTPTLSPKGISPTSPSPGKPKKKPVKPERSGSRASSVASASSSLTSLSSSTSEPANHETQPNISSPPQQGSPPPLAATTNKKVAMANEAPRPVTVVTGEQFNIPPPPKVKAPSPPPPETWAHNRRTFELLCGPCPNVNRLAQQNKQPQSRESNAKAATQTEVNNKSQGSAKNQPLVEKVALSLSETETISQGQAKPWFETVPGCVSQEVKSVECTKQSGLLVSEKDKASVEVQRLEDSRNPIKTSESQKSLAEAKTDPPTVMKKCIPVSLRTEPEKATECQQQKRLDDITTLVTNHVQSSTGNQSVSVPKVDFETVDKSKEVKVILAEENPTISQQTIQTLSVDTPKVVKISPPPSPPPAHHPPPPPSKQTHPPSVSSPQSEERESVEEDEVVPIVETCWPPPPPPLDLVFDGSDEMDFPPPPPPMTEISADVVESCTTTTGVQDDSMVAPAEAEVTVKGECADKSSIMVQPGLGLSRPEVAGHSKIASIISDAHQLRTLPEVTPIDFSIPTNETATAVAQEHIIIQEDAGLSIETPMIKNVPPPPPMQAASAPLTTLVKEFCGSFPLAAPPSVPLPPPLPFEDQPPSQPPVTAPCPPPVNGLSPSPPPAESAAGVAFRRQPSLVSRETRCKELSSRHKSAPMPKEDANIPLVTPSLLQMVRLRSVNVGEEQTKPQSEHSSNGSALDQGPTSTAGPQGTPQKPIRKSLSLKSPPPSLRTPSVVLNAPSMRLQEAIRMKTAAMSSRDGLPTRLSMRSSTSPSYCSTGEPGVQSRRAPEGGDLQKSPASTASFIFSRSTKKVVIETPSFSSTEPQESLKQSLAAELMQVSEQVSKVTTVVSNGIDEKSNLLRKPGKVPPPVAKKPVSCTANQTEMPAHAEGERKVTVGGEAIRSIGMKQPAGQQVSPNEKKEDNAETSDMGDIL